MAIQTKNLSYAYQQNETMRFADFDCQQGEHWLILGQSGTGKTTLLHLLAGLLSPASGEILIEGTAINNLSGRALDQFRGKKIGIVFQKPHFVKALNVQQNLKLAMQMAGNKPDSAAIQDLLEKLNLSHKLKASTQDLSEGEKQRVSIARALVNKPALILADEPTSALDDDNCEEVIQLLSKTASDYNTSLLIVTHDMRLKARFPNKIML